MTFAGLEEFDRLEDRNETILFRAEDLFWPDAPTLGLEGFYFPPQAGRFVSRTPNGEQIAIMHPSMTVLNLRVARALDCAWPGFIGLYAFGEFTEHDEPTFIVSGSSGNLRRNTAGEVWGDALFCVYPRPAELPAVRELEFRPAKQVEPTTRQF